MKWLKKILDNNLLLRRINIRQVNIFEGTPLHETAGNKFIRKNKKYIYVGFDANLAKLLLRFFPVRGEIFINWLIMRVERKAKQRSLTWVKRKPLLKNLFQFEFTK